MKTIFKFIISIPIICTFLIGVVFLGLGVYKTFEGFTYILKGYVDTNVRPGVLLFEALDVFLFAFLFFIFSIGFSQLFIPKPSRIKKAFESITPEWLKVHTFTELKLILWDTVLTTLVVFFVGNVFRNEKGIYNWETTIIPVTIILISFSKYIIKKSEDK
jgi:uncharacterized membrane protein YqhA